MYFGYQFNRLHFQVFFKMPKGVFCVVSKNRAIGLSAIFVGSLLTVGLLVYFLAERPLHKSTACEDSVASLIDRNSTDLEANSTLTTLKNTKNVRLPRAVLPRHYELRLLPILQNANFSILGRVSIDIECFEDTDRIVLHSLDINVDPRSVTVTNVAFVFVIINVDPYISIQVTEKNQINTKLLLNGIDFDNDVEFLIINPKAKLVKGRNYTLSMSFIGNLNDQLKGFYRSSYMEDGIERQDNFLFFYF